MDRRRKPVSPLKPAARDTRDALIAEHMAFVVQVARRVARKLPSHIDLDDLIAAGNLGLVDAATRFDPKHGMRFEGFAESRIRGAMFDAIRVNDTLSRDMRRVSNHIRTVARDLEKTLDRSPDQAEIAGQMGVTVDALAKMQLRLEGGNVVGYEDTMRDGKDFFEIHPDPKAVDVVQAVARGELIEILQTAIEKLPEKMQRALTLYYCHDLSLDEIGVIIGRTQSRACQLVGQACELLRQDLALGKIAKERDQ